MRTSVDRPVKPVHNVANAVRLLVRLQYLIVAPDFENHDVVESAAFVVHLLLVRSTQCHCALNKSNSAAPSSPQLHSGRFICCLA